MSRVADADRRGSRPTVLVAALALGATALALQQSLVVPVLGAIGEQLGVSAGAAGWVLTANLLAAAVSTPVSAGSVTPGASARCCSASSSRCPWAACWPW